MSLTVVWLPGARAPGSHDLRYRGNDYDKVFTVRGRTDCDVRQHRVRGRPGGPECGHCGCRIPGHGVETEVAIFCCAHCARKESGADINDRYPVPAGG